MMTRWEALVRFDDEIRGAAARLIPFGSIWVDKLGEAFLALNEDRKYLPNIVDRLLNEAMQEAREAEREAREAERAAELLWLTEVARTPDGGQTSKESLAVLIELRARGYRIFKEQDGAIGVGRDSGISYARSNGEIINLGRFLLGNPRTE